MTLIDDAVSRTDQADLDNPRQRRDDQRPEGAGHRKRGCIPHRRRAG
jgi:hypothetical protein